MNNKVWLIIGFLMSMAVASSRAQTYNGIYYSPQVEGMHTDNWFNLQPNSGATVANSWNVYHKDGNSLFSVAFGATSPTVQVGQGRATNFIVNGSASIGTSDLLTSTKLRVYEAGSSSTVWRGRVAASGELSAVVMGEWAGKACVGAHNTALSTWSDLILQHGGGNLGIGTMNPAQRLEVNGGILQNAENVGWGIDAQPNARLGFIKKFGFGPMLAADNGSPIIFTQSNQLGIHTNIAGATLTERMRIDGNGNVGIGVSNPTTQLSIRGAQQMEESVLNITNMSDQDFQVKISAPAASIKRTIIGTSTINRFSLGVNLKEHMTIVDGGNVGIGTVSPDTKLAVKGTVHASEVRIDLTVPGPDYVFEKSYPLASLDFVQSYIDKNKHLPEIPTAKVMETEGVKLGEMNMLLLKKIEELTLYAIKSNADIDEIKKENLELKKRLALLESK